ncbi:hypothetical protein VTL71DRAFT_11281 [Oculimacula yallundae]|uniref:Heterokaryon incompatibility domain-containing protein n=1 Tax=Oculimacula yallundae TaxID=86028 RepID=A0ABR4CQB3_9HELO
MENAREAGTAVCFACLGGHAFEKGGEIALSQLTIASQDGCIICGLLVEIVLKCVPGVTAASGGKILIATPLDIFRIDGTSTILVADSPEAEILAGEDAFFKIMPMRSAPSGYTGSDMAMNRALEWIAECTSSHNLCGDNFPKLLPNRVLDLGSGDVCLEARIVSGGGRSSRYGTLSHCWGQHGNQRVLTRATLHMWQQLFPVSQLPRIYQDAIAVAKRIGLQYLWIDSLCIIQDDKEDWIVESSSMADVYQNSYVTIAATCAVDSAAGMFSTTRPRYRPKAISYRRNGVAAQIYASKCLSHHDHYYASPYSDWIARGSPEGSSDMPLLSRAWVYQERILSPRVLHFMKEELVFECLTESQCECRTVPSAFPPVKNKHALSILQSFGNGSGSEIRRGAQSALQVRWHAIVGEYSRLSMTFEKDRLTALSGIVTQMQTYRKEDYYAGLWSSSFLDDLGWYKSKKDRVPIPKVRAAPSWSWAAVNGAVTYDDSLSVSHSAKVLRIACEEPSSDKSRVCVSGWIEVSGIMCNGMLRASTTGSEALDLRLTPGHNGIHNVYTDHIIDENFEDGGLKISCLALWANSDPQWTGRNVSLLLRKVPNETDTYERIGRVVHWEGGNFSPETPRSRIKII